MAEPRSIRERERQLASRAKAEEAARQKRRAATTKRGGQVLETYQPDTITGTLYEGLASGIGGLGRLFGASERAATQRGRDAVENLKVLTEGLIGPEETERSFRRIAGGRGGAEDYVLAGLTVAPVPGAVRRAAGRVGKRVAGKARNLAAKVADTRLGRYMTESRAIPEINTRTAFSTSERVPYVGSGHLSGVVGGSDAIKARYSSAPRASWANRQGGELAALAPGIPMRVKIDSGYQSMFEDAGGEGSGVATDRLAELLANYTPKDIANLDRSTALRKAGVALPSIAALMAAYGLQPAEGEMQDVGY